MNLIEILPRTVLKIYVIWENKVNLEVISSKLWLWVMQKLNSSQRIYTQKGLAWHFGKTLGELTNNTINKSKILSNRGSSWPRNQTPGLLPCRQILFWATRESHREGNGNPLQYSCLENPMGRRAQWAAVHGVAKSWTRLSDFTFTFHFHALEKEMATHSSVLAWRIPGTAEPGGLPSMGQHRVRHDWSDLAAAAAAAAGNPSHMHIAFNEFSLKPMKQTAKLSVPKKDEDFNGSLSCKITNVILGSFQFSFLNESALHLFLI